MPSESTRTASLPPKLDAFIAAKDASGRYRSASEVVRAALRLHQALDQQGEHKQQNSAEKEQDAR